MQAYDRVLRLLEAYMYDNNPEAWTECDALVTAYVVGLKDLSAADLEQQRRALTKLRNALNFLQRFAMIPNDYAPEQELKRIAAAQGWLKKR